MRIKSVYILIAVVIIIILFFFYSTENVRENEKELHALDQNIMLHLRDSSLEVIGHEEAGDECKYYYFDGERVKEFSVRQTDDFEDDDLNYDFYPLVDFINNNYEDISEIKVYRGRHSILEDQNDSINDDRVVYCVEAKTSEKIEHYTKIEEKEYIFINIKEAIGVKDRKLVWDNYTYIYEGDTQLLNIEKIHDFYYDSSYPIYYYKRDSYNREIVGTYTVRDDWGTLEYWVTYPMGNLETGSPDEWSIHIYADGRTWPLSLSVSENIKIDISRNGDFVQSFQTSIDAGMYLDRLFGFKDYNKDHYMDFMIRSDREPRSPGITWYCWDPDNHCYEECEDNEDYEKEE